MIETKDIVRPPAELIEGLRHIGTATASSTLNRMGIRNAHICGPVARNPGKSLVGPALTLQFMPKREDLYGVDEYAEPEKQLHRHALYHTRPGDFVVVVNAEKVKFTGNKWARKEYRWYTGYPGQRAVTAETRRERQPELIIHEAVRRMLPKNKLANKMITKLKIYAGSEHPHQAQQPSPLEIATK